MSEFIKVQYTFISGMWRELFNFPVATYVPRGLATLPAVGAICLRTSSSAVRQWLVTEQRGSGRPRPVQTLPSFRGHSRVCSSGPWRARPRAAQQCGRTGFPARITVRFELNEANSAMPRGYRSADSALMCARFSQSRTRNTPFARGVNYQRAGRGWAN